MVKMLHSGRGWANIILEYDQKPKCSCRGFYFCVLPGGGIG